MYIATLCRRSGNLVYSRFAIVTLYRRSGNLIMGYNIHLQNSFIFCFISILVYLQIINSCGVRYLTQHLMLSKLNS